LETDSTLLDKNESLKVKIFVIPGERPADPLGDSWEINTRAEVEEDGES